MAKLNSKNMLEACETKGIHADIVDFVKSKLPDPDKLSDLAGLFMLFGDNTRIRILWALSESEMCVCDLCSLLSLKQPTVSHQLKNLKLSKIVKARRDGKVIYYSLEDDHIRKLLDLGMEHIKE